MGFLYGELSGDVADPVSLQYSLLIIGVSADYI